jgi:chromosome segregation protein
MHLKSIALKGFKSFPDRTRLEFGRGVSVVVGPNGSGKSNITDAVLWALGEQSAAAVRGSSMQDVIFAGAPGRQAATGAEVELALDDSDGSLGLGVPEVSIVRRLDRGGEGEYRLAGARCRLVDVIEVLSDTGLGKEMHSVISQGRVESLVTSKPRDRRLLIEEAAGLGKHRKRRRRAQLKLERTQQNLDRALDVEREARSRLRPLKRQAEAAELHERLERQSLEARWELARDDLRSWRQELRAAETAVDQVRARRGALERELEAVAARREAAEEALAARSARREELSRRSFVAQSASERVAYRGEALAATRATIEARTVRARELLDRLRSEAAGDQGDEQAHARAQSIERELVALERDREREVAAHVADLERRREEADRVLAERTDAGAHAQQERRRAEQSVEAARFALREAERSVEAARREAARVGGELASVNQLLRSNTRLLTGADALADQLNVDPGYELALAAALDGRLGAALAADRAEASRLLDRAGEIGGRVLIARPPRGDESSTSPPAPGAEPLSSHVRGGGEAAVVARALLGDTWVLDDLDAVAEAFDGVAVTRSGRVWVSRTRELRQAPALGEDRVLSERNRREQLVRASEAAAQAELAARSGVEQAAAAVSERETEREAAVARDRAAVRDRDDAAEEEQRLSALIERRRAAPDEGPEAARRAHLAAELDAERRMLERSRRERAEREQRIDHLAESIERDRALLPTIGRLGASLQAVGEAIAQQRVRFEQALAADREAGEQVALELRSCAKQEAELQGRLHGENEALTEAEVRAQRGRDQASDVERDMEALSSRLGLDPAPSSEELGEEHREALRQRIERLARRREQLGPVNPLAQEEYRQAVEHVEDLERQREDLETALRELEKLIQDTDRQIRDSFEQTFAATAQNFEEVVGQLFPGGRGSLRLVHAREEAPARTLGRQDADVQDVSTPEDEDVPTPGDEDDVLGVEIEITPAGKEMKRLSLLSGGEKSMTALAFLFAVFLARPCPFYILDEVEAALDDLNIDRFLDLLRSYSTRAQFIVVTHQKRTMEAADCLYGVSMGSDGISKVISRRLREERAAA